MQETVKKESYPLSLCKYAKTYIYIYYRYNRLIYQIWRIDDIKVDIYWYVIFMIYIHCSNEYNQYLYSKITCNSGNLS